MCASFFALLDTDYPGKEETVPETVGLLEKDPENVASEDVADAKAGLVKHKGGRNAGEKFRKRSYCGKKDSAKERTGKRSCFIKHIHIFGSFDGHKSYQSGNNKIEQINHFYLEYIIHSLQPLLLQM